MPRRGGGRRKGTAHMLYCAFRHDCPPERRVGCQGAAIDRQQTGSSLDRGNMGVLHETKTKPTLKPTPAVRKRPLPDSIGQRQRLALRAREDVDVQNNKSVLPRRPSHAATLQPVASHHNRSLNNQTRERSPLKILLEHQVAPPLHLISPWAACETIPRYHTYHRKQIKHPAFLFLSRLPSPPVPCRAPFSALAPPPRLPLTKRSY